MKIKEINLCDVADEWLEIRRMYVKLSTYEKYTNIITTHLKPFFKCHDSIDDSSVFEYMKNNIEEKKLSASMMHSIRFTLKSILDYAEKKYDYKHVEFQYIKLPMYSKGCSVLSNKEMEQLVSYCFYEQNSISTAIIISLYGGLRLGEICALSWKDIDLSDGIITVNQTVQRLKQRNSKLSKTALIISIPKSDTSYRKVVIPQFLQSYLIEYYKHLGIKDGYILTGSSKIADPRTIQYQFKRVCHNLGFQTNFHTLRHTYATNCVKSGVDIKTLSEMLGHSDISITLSRYVHSSIELKRLQVEKIKIPTVMK